MPKFQLALVTGASSGIGWTLAERLADQGISLIVSGRNETALNHLADSLREKVNVVVQPADLTVPAEREALKQKIRELAPDLVVNNAGFGAYGPAVDMDLDLQKKMIEVNASVVYELTLTAAKALLERGLKGTILNVSSVAGQITMPYFAAYAASKSFVIQASVALDEELKEQGVRVLVSCPGQVWTNFSRRAALKKDYTADESGKMTALFAAEEILTQIKSGKQVHTFNWKFACLAFLVKYVFPHRLAMHLLKKRMKSRF